MNKKLKSQLKFAFAAPAPTRKDGFLLSINFPKASRFDFVIGQIGYIRKRVWFVSSFLLAITLFILHVCANENAIKVVWIASSILPFVALVMIMEIARSVAFNMEELEMTCKYSLADVVLVRLGVLGSFNFVSFGLFVVSLIGKTDFSILRLGIYLFTPFLFTCSLSFFMLNHLRSREMTYICGGISCFISVTTGLLTSQSPVAFLDKYLPVWNIAFFVWLLWGVRETIRLIKKMEELQWNLQLTA